jgi:hypothetical protein
VAKYLGDGPLIYFGYPRAHEDDAQQAVQAGALPLGELRLSASCLCVGLVPSKDTVRAGASGDLGPFRRISLRALEKRFTGNQHLTQCDANANDLEDLFDFTNAPSMGANVAPGLAQGPAPWTSAVDQRICRGPGELSA